LKALNSIASLAVAAVLLGGSSQAWQNQSSARAHGNSSIVAAKATPERLSSIGEGEEVFTHQKAGIQFQLPKGWKAEPDGEQITVSAPDDSYTLVFWVPDEGTFEEAVQALDEELSKTVKKKKTVGKPRKGTHNGMPHYTEVGTGEVEAVPINWSVDLLQAKSPLIILTFFVGEVDEKNAGDYKKLVMSIKKVS
jgi:hypothetical protein